MKVIALLCMVGLCVGLLFSGNAMAKTLFFDDFEAGADKWPAMPTLSIEEDPDKPGNSVLAFDAIADNANVDAFFMEGYEELTDYTMKARFNIVGESANYAVAGLIVRAEAVGQNMVIEPAVNRQGVPQMVNVFDRGAAWAIVADGEAELEMNKWYELSVTVADVNLTVFVDGKLVAEFNDVPYAKGGFGIRQWASKALYDDVEVYDAGGSDMSPVEPGGKLTTAWGALRTGSL
ncbi:family 16 glycoside hydrolase [Candidatus Poribacteria bacterium]